MDINKAFINAFTKKYWRNISDKCNGKTHPWRFNLTYRPYRRGKNRCLECGAKFGKIKCERKSCREYLQEQIREPNPLYAALKESGLVVHN